MKNIFLLAFGALLILIAFFINDIFSIIWNAKYDDNIEWNGYEIALGNHNYVYPLFNKTILVIGHDESAETTLTISKLKDNNSTDMINAMCKSEHEKCEIQSNYLNNNDILIAHPMMNDNNQRDKYYIGVKNSNVLIEYFGEQGLYKDFNIAINSLLDGLTSRIKEKAEKMGKKGSEGGKRGRP